MLLDPRHLRLGGSEQFLELLRVPSLLVVGVGDCSFDVRDGPFRAGPARGRDVSFVVGDVDRGALLQMGVDSVEVRAEGVEVVVCCAEGCLVGFAEGVVASGCRLTCLGVEGAELAMEVVQGAADEEDTVEVHGLARGGVNDMVKCGEDVAHESDFEQ